MAKGRKTGGRLPGTPNKINAQLREMILGALDAAGGQAYLERAAEQEPRAFLALLGRVLPTQLTGAGGGEMVFHVKHIRVPPREVDDGSRS